MKITVNRKSRQVYTFKMLTYVSQFLTYVCLFLSEPEIYIFPKVFWYEKLLLYGLSC